LGVGSRLKEPKLVSAKLSANAFASAARKVEWAVQHIANMEKVLSTAHEANRRTFLANDDAQPDRVNMAIDFGDFLRYSLILQMMAGDAIHNLRCALDHLAWAIVSAFKEPDPHLYFPIDVELKSLVGHRSFREIKAVAPDIADLIVSEIKPYGAGNPFVKLNHLDRADKHRLLLVHVVAAEGKIYMAKDDDDDIAADFADCFILIANPTRVPRPGSKAALHNDHYRGLAFDVRFDPGLPCENESVIPALHQFAQLVTGVIKTLTAHVEGR